MIEQVDSGIFSGLFVTVYERPAKGGKIVLIVSEKSGQIDTEAVFVPDQEPAAVAEVVTEVAEPVAEVETEAKEGD